MNKKWYKWPEGYIGMYVPWYVIVRRLLVTPTLYIGFIIFYISVVIGYGVKEAERVAKDIL